MLNSQRFSEDKINRALDLLYINRRDEFRELSKELLPEKALLSMTNWKEFVLNFSLDVEESFKSWSGQSELPANSPQIFNFVTSIISWKNIYESVGSSTKLVI